MDIYIPNPTHRNDNPVKSQWIISAENENFCWEDAKKREWRDPEKKFLWGLVYTVNTETEEKTLLPLGLTAQYREESKIARFEHTTANPEEEVWHGYPVNYMRRPSDVPHVSVLKKWVDDNFIAKHSMVKLRKCMPCNL